MADDSTSLLGASRPTPPPVSSTSASSATTTSGAALYHDESQSPSARRIQILFVGLVVIMVLVSVVLSIVQAVQADANGGMYLLLGICLLGFAVIEIIMIVFTRRGDLPKGKTWFLYVVGFLVMLEAIFTDVILYA